jgi:hypothetical protein
MALSKQCDDQALEIARCRRDFPRFAHAWCQIYNAASGDWIPFRLWPRQVEVARVLTSDRLVVILKARQLGMTWLCLAYALWLMIFRPAAAVLIFCRADREAVYLLSPERLRGMWQRLPIGLRFGLTVTDDSAHAWGLSNGSVARALPSGAGDAFTVTYALVDEADVCPDLNDLLRRAKPTIDAGGRMTLLSRSNKKEPQSTFKAIYRAARRRENDWTPVFLPWTARPERDEAWYEAQKRDVLARTGSLDDLWEQYPLTDEQSLRPAQLDKRLAPAWLDQCAAERAPLDVVPNAPAIPGLRIFAPPQGGHRYVIGVDPAEGNPSSDPSAFQVLDCNIGEQVAALAEKVEPKVLASYVDQVGTWYNSAAVMLEVNNHGWAVLLWLGEHSRLRILSGLDGKPGWKTTSLSKTMMYNTTADAFRNGEVHLHDFATLTELALIEGGTLSAPRGEYDDLAMAFALCCAGRAQAASWGFDAIGGTGKRTESRWKPPQ